MLILKSHFILYSRAISNYSKSIIILKIINLPKVSKSTISDDPSPVEDILASVQFLLPNT